jgi:hypothetical protein
VRLFSFGGRGLIAVDEWTKRHEKEHHIWHYLIAKFVYENDLPKANSTTSLLVSPSPQHSPPKVSITRVDSLFYFSFSFFPANKLQSLIHSFIHSHGNAIRDPLNHKYCKSKSQNL